MKQVAMIVGILLIIFGIVTLGYHGFSYTKQEKVAQFGDIQITANEQKNIHFSPLMGGLSFIAGIVLVITSRINKK